jgi:hypothetical protein
LAFGGGNYLVVWRRRGSQPGIFAVRVDTDGRLLDDSPIEITRAGSANLIGVVFNGHSFVVIWEGAESVFAAYVLPSGELDDSAGGCVIEWDPDSRVKDLAVFRGPGGRPLVLYSLYTAPPDYGNYRIWGRFLDRCTGPLPLLPVLEDNFPNPFSSSTTLRFHLQSNDQVSVKIYDVEGRLVRTLLSGFSYAGAREVTWDGQLDTGEKAAAGVYFCCLESSGGEATGKIVFIR